MSLLSQIQSFRNSIWISKYIYFYIRLSHLTPPCWAHKTVMDHFPPAVGETLPSACSRAAWSQISGITRPWGQSSQCKVVDTRVCPVRDSQTGTSPPFPTSLWTSDIDREPEKYLISVRALWVSVTCHLKNRNNRLPRRVMTACTSNMARLYLILCQWYREISLPLHKYPNLSFFLIICKK